MSSESEDEDYKVGPGRPPRHTRFKKGQSGNPGGRPKRVMTRKMMQTIFEEVFLDQSMTLNRGGQREEVPVLQAILHRLSHMGVEGNLKAINTILDFVPKVTDEAASSAPVEVPEEDRAILERLIGNTSSKKRKK